MIGYRIQICSDVDYEQLIAEVYIDAQFIALVSHEKPDAEYFVELPGSNQNEAAIIRKVEFSTLLAALAEARARLDSGG